ncbi:MAG: thiamine-phosphate kinase [Thiohalophilus sp.]|jgi:thiamine-monophosphate kinase
MPLSEFDIIQKYFTFNASQREDVALGVGDDAALITPPAGQQLAVAIDTLVAGVHFPETTDPYDIGWKSLAVNLSDLAAMGAEPAWFTLALTLEQADEEWLAAFSAGLSNLASQSGIQLVGGDTTRGPLTISVQVAGYVPIGQALKRSGVNSGDEIWVSGTPGDAALGLQCAQDRIQGDNSMIEYLRGRLDRPQPRTQLGMALRGLASACIDVSDGLLADLQHLCEASDCGASVHFHDIPLSNAARQAIGMYPDYADLPLLGGDDYELCFTAPAKQHDAVQALGNADLPVSCIGRIEAEAGVRCLDEGGELRGTAVRGYQHFGDR